MDFSVDKCKVMHMGKTNLSVTQKKIMTSVLTITTWEQDLHIMIYRSVKTSG